MSYQGNQQQRRVRSGPPSSSAGGSANFKIAEDEDYDLCSQKWGEQINNYRESDNNNSQATQEKLNGTGGLGTELIKLMKKATHEKKASAGKRKPLGNVNIGKKLLQARAKDKKELQKVQRKVQEHAEMC